MNPPREITIDELKEHLEKHKARLESKGNKRRHWFLCGLVLRLGRDRLFTISRHGVRQT